MHARLASSVLAALGAAFFLTAASGACSSSDADPGAATTSTSSSSGSTSISANDCKSRCSTKATACSGPTSACDQFCAGSVTEGQASCLENKTCDALAEAVAKGSSLSTICPTSTSTSSSSSSGSSTSSSGAAATIPDSLAIKASIKAGYTPSHTSASGKIISIFNVAAAPTFSPSPPAGQLPSIFDVKTAQVTADSPSLGACAATFHFTLNSGEVSVQIEGADEGTKNDCGSFTDKAAKDGVKLTLKNVAWANSTKTSTVTIELN